MKRGYFKICGRCGANLDPGERCDCDRRRSDTRAQEIPQTIEYVPRPIPHEIRAQTAV